MSCFGRISPVKINLTGIELVWIAISIGYDIFFIQPLDQ